MNWLNEQMGSLPGLTPWLLGVALAISALGFRRVVYFVSVGYAFSIAGMAVVAVLAGSGAVGSLPIDAIDALQLVLLAAWGVRLGVFIIGRDRQAAYRNQLEGNQAYDLGMTFARRLPIWLGVALLYVAMFSPALFAASGEGAMGGLPATVRVSGLAVMALGLVLEAAADRQKSTAKAANPGRFTDTGLYRWVRCPNYLGEILFWTGNLIAGLVFLSSPLRGVVAFTGWLCLVLIMIGSTKRLEEQQDERYGDEPAYQEYVRTVPVLIPWTPVYSLKNVKVYLG